MLGPQGSAPAPAPEAWLWEALAHPGPTFCILTLTPRPEPLVAEVKASVSSTINPHLFADVCVLWAEVIGHLCWSL